MDTLNFGEQLLDVAAAFPAGYYRRIWFSVIAGASTGPVMYSSGIASVRMAWLLAVCVLIVLWIVLGRIPRQHPLARPGAIGITNKRFVAFRGRSREVIAEHPLAEYESHRYRRGFENFHGVAVSPSLKIRFQDGGEWRVSDPLGFSDLAHLVYTLDQLTADD